MVLIAGRGAFVYVSIRLFYFCGITGMLGILSQCSGEGSACSSYRAISFYIDRLFRQRIFLNY
ncbi:hypothetical protein BC832DRAFT_159081 [Gaertneriomyces semiglobifer]|nr:hypothetical protein BC832DRAFT_159081 [Gaertneriomyces semiglobifer]